MGVCQTSSGPYSPAAPVKFATTVCDAPGWFTMGTFTAGRQRCGTAVGELAVDAVAVASLRGLAIFDPWLAH